MKKILAFLTVVLISLPSFSARGNPSSANRRTAVRYLQLAKQYAAEGRWAESDSQSRLGLQYDGSVADLWYMQAVARQALGGSRAEILPLVTKSLDGKETDWVDYNRDNARVLCADILCSSLRPRDAIKLLDSKPMVYSADAEFIRVKSYYSLGDKDSLAKARSRVDTARKVYPDDVRFAELFYNFEYLKSFCAGGLSSDVKRIAGSFFACMGNYASVNDDVRLLSSLFTLSGDELVRSLKAFDSENHRSVLFATYGFLNGILDRDGALDYFYGYSDSSPVRLSVLEVFAAAVFGGEMDEGGETLRKEFFDYLNSFSGTILDDTNGDGTCDMTVLYKRGRALAISYDGNQDGVDDWVADCDFGVPVAIHVGESRLDVGYGTWPFVRSAVYDVSDKVGDGTKVKKLSFNLIADTLSWTPFDIVFDSVLKEAVGIDFFIPSIPKKRRAVSGTDLLLASTSYSLPSAERPDAYVTVTVLGGIPQSARYTVGGVDGRMYATARFEDGLPVMRLVDSDDDGLFETTEMFGHDSEKKGRFMSEADELQVVTNLFGTPAKGTGVYVKMIQVDWNGDTVPDFIEEYTEGLGKISTWDSDGDGKWDVRYVKRPESKDGVKREDSLFHQPFSGDVVTVSSENGIPVNVSISSAENGKVLRKNVRIFGGLRDGFYWIGGKERDDIATGAVEIAVNRELGGVEQGVSKVIQIEDARYHAVRVGSMVFVEILPSDSGEK